MKSERAKFLAGIILIPLCLLLVLEMAFRFSRPFNDFVYVYSSPRESDHFRVYYRLSKAVQDRQSLKVGFLGSSVTRDGIDVNLFRERFPGISFYNFGGSLKVPQFENALAEDYKKAGFRILVYPISPTDIFKFRDSESLAVYPDVHRLAGLIDKWSLWEIYKHKDGFLTNLLSAASLTYRFRLPLSEAVRNAAAARLGFAPQSDFEFFWKQQPLDEEPVIDRKMKYNNRTRKYFNRKVKIHSDEMEILARRLDAAGIFLVLWDLDPTCPRYMDQQRGRVMDAAEDFSESLKELPSLYPKVKYFKAGSFACEDYAELFHLNARGRRVAFERLSVLLEPFFKEAGAE